MGFWRRSRQRPQSASGAEHADDPASPAEPADLIGLADHLAVSDPGSGPAIDAARRAAEAAEELADRSGTVANRRQLARALWRQASTFMVAGDPVSALLPAQRCWELCAGILKTVGRTDAAASDADDVVGEVVSYLGVVTAALGAAGLREEASRVYDAGVAAVARADGPRGHQARARLAVYRLTAGADFFAEARMQGLWEQISGSVHEAIGEGLEVAAVLRRHADEGVTETTELARTLQVVSRLQTVAGQLADAAATLDEAAALMSGVADRGPALRAFLQGLRAERDGLRGYVPAPTTQASPLPPQAFARAARDLGDRSSDDHASAPLPDTVAGAAAVADRFHAHEPADPGYYGPLRGLAMARHAQLLVDAGQPAAARDLADQAVRQLMRFSDQPDRLQAALVVALTVLAQAAQAIDDQPTARQARQRATGILRLLTHRDPTYTADLGQVP
ncbi:hypothetical protein LUX12_04465 [Streptomyces somaliensis]|uniref:hypothetical protein n=1 Tax=Streptomyces somaliensis TaxID=78355 RepID=UPI0020CC0AC3|nr:hypothetical protein [Streptomyces somaliensis]MCP9944211.1 hypothetical protein [Streptomyces somaliensis]MCP9962552.1 hypothetical protein [Streptomyces somaliensis]MCP9975379.1 hypothetical protein [Streptomyces somaliensis]